MQNGNQWQSRQQRFNRNNDYDGDRQKNQNNSGNWVQQKGDGFNKGNKNDDKSFISNKGNNESALAPPPAPPNLGGNLQKRLGGNKSGGGGKDKFQNNNRNFNQNNNQSQQNSNQSQNQASEKNYDQQNHGYGNRREGGGYNRRSGNYVDKIKERVKELSGPQYDLPTLSTEEKKFNSQCRLFIGNLPRDINIEELKAEFAKFGEIGQIYFNKDSAYGFISFDYKHNACKAATEMQGKPFNGRPLTVRFAAVSSGVKVKNLSPYVSNELLEKAFSVFGQIESCRVTVDNRGKPNGEGIIIFSEKKNATLAIKKCDEDCYFLTSSLQPVVVEPLETNDEGDGQPEASMPKNEMYRKEREIGPHFADPMSFQYEYGLRWKQLFYLFNEKKTALERDFHAECDALAAKLSLVKHEYETEQLRRELAAREAESSYLHAEAEYRMNTASFSSFHDPATGATGTIPNYDNRYEQQFDRGTYDRSYDRSSMGRTSMAGAGTGTGAGGFGFDNANTNANQSFGGGMYNQADDRSYNQSFNRGNAAAGNEGAMNMNDQRADNSMNNAAPAAAPASGRLAGRLQDRRPAGSEEPIAAKTETPAAAATNDEPQLSNRILERSTTLALNRDRGNAAARLDRPDLNMSLSSRQNDHSNDLNQSLSSRQQDQHDLNRSLGNRRENMGDLNRSLSSRQDNMGDLNRSLSSRQEMGRGLDRVNQGDQPLKRTRY